MESPIVCQVCKALIRLPELVQFVEGRPVCLICRCCHDDEEISIEQALAEAIKTAAACQAQAQTWADWVRAA